MAENKDIDIKDMLEELKHGICDFKLYLMDKFNQEEEGKEFETFDLFEADYNDIRLDKDTIIKVFSDIEDKVQQLLYDVRDSGIKFYDFKKANSDFAKYMRNKSNNKEESLTRYGLYQNGLFNQIKNNVNKDFIDFFNKNYEKCKGERYPLIYRKGRYGDSNKEDIFDLIYAEILNLPLHRNIDYFDDKGHYMGSNVKYSEHDMTSKSINADKDGEPLFIFVYKVDNEGNYKNISIRIKDKWFILYTNNLK